MDTGPKNHHAPPLFLNTLLSTRRWSQFIKNDMRHIFIIHGLNHVCGFFLGVCVVFVQRQRSSRGCVFGSVIFFLPPWLLCACVCGAPGCLLRPKDSSGSRRVNGFAPFSIPLLPGVAGLVCPFPAMIKKIGPPTTYCCPVLGQFGTPVCGVCRLCHSALCAVSALPSVSAMSALFLLGNGIMRRLRVCVAPLCCAAENVSGYSISKLCAGCSAVRSAQFCSCGCHV